MVPSEVSNNSTTSASSSSITSNVIEHNPQGIKLEDHKLISSQQTPLQTLQTTIRDDPNAANSGNQKSRMTLGQMALAGIVISSGPGDHFETYEGHYIIICRLALFFSPKFIKSLTKEF